MITFSKHILDRRIIIIDINVSLMRLCIMEITTKLVCKSYEIDDRALTFCAFLF